MESAPTSNSGFTRYWLGMSAAMFAYQMVTVAVGWQIYDLTNSALALGLIGLAQFAPQFLFSLVAGQIADRYDRRLIAFLCQLAEGATAFMLALGSYMQWLTSDLIFVAAFLVGAARAFESPTGQALLPAVVSAEFFPKAIAWTSTMRNMATILGPPLGGVIYLLGPQAVYAASALVFIVGSILIIRVRLYSTPRHRAPMSLSGMFAGISFMRTKPVISGALLLDLFAVLLGSVVALLPIYARDILHTGPLGLGILRGAPAIGAVLASIYLAQKPLERHVGPIMFVSVAVFALGTIVFAVSSYFPLSVVALAVAGAADTVSVVIRTALVQLETPDEMRGRVSAVNSLLIGTSNQLGQFRSGAAAAWLGTVPSAVLGGVAAVIVVIVCARLFPELARRDRLSSADIEASNPAAKA